MTNVDLQPTPELEDACQNIYRHWLTGDLSFRDAIDQMSKLAQQVQLSGHYANQARVEHLLGNMQGRRGNLNPSLTHFERARNLFYQVGNWNGVAMMDHNIGETYRHKGDYVRARQLLHKAYESADKLGLYDLKTMAIVNEGQVLLSMERYDQAYAALNEAFQLYGKWMADTRHRPGVLSEIHYGLAIVELHRPDLISAWSHARKALEEAQESGEQLYMGIAYRCLGDVITALETVPEPDADAFSSDPIFYYQESILNLRGVRAEAEHARTLLAYGKSLASQGRQLLAERQLQQSLLLFTRLDMMADAARAAKAQAEIGRS